MPLLLWVAERPPVATQGHYPNPFVQLGTTLRKICGQRNLLLFLLAYFCYIDGVNTVIKMAVEYFQSIDIALETSQIMLGLLTVQFVGFPAALLFVKVGEKLGAKRGIMICIGVYAVLTVWSFMVHTQVEFFCMAVVIGSVIGGIQALSRSLYSRLIPQDQAAEYFGIYNILGKFAAIAGPLIVGVSSSCLGPRFGLISLLPLFIIGGLLLARVRTQPLQGR